MLADFKHKRKSAGFIRNSSNKALPTFKMLQKNESSDDFSSFEAEKPLQESQGEFSPYKHPPNNIPNRPPLPAKNRHVAKQPVQIFTNEKLKRNYQANNFIESPNRGKIVNVREEQIKQTMRKRAQVSNQLAQIDKICNRIQSLKSPQSYKDRYQKLMSEINQHKSLQKKTDPIHKQKPSLSQQKSSSRKFKVQQQQQEQQQQQQISFDSKRKKPSPVPTPKSQQQMLKQAQKQRQSDKINSHHKSKQSYSGVTSKTQKYKFEQSDLSSNQEEQKDDEQEQDSKQPSFHQNTFKPNANKQILNSIKQYQKTHPEISFKNTNQKYQNKNHKHQFSQKQKIQKQENKVKLQHDNARKRFISQKQQYSDSEHPQQQQQEIQVEQEQSEDLINEYPKQQFKQTTIKQCVQMRENIPHKNNKNLKTIQNQSGLYKTKGGICFDLDVNQFTQNDAKPVSKPTQHIPKKPKKVDTKQQILKRRQMAKNYDRQARAVVFGGY